jgi:hypothetical protein
MGTIAQAQGDAKEVVRLFDLALSIKPDRRDLLRQIRSGQRRSNIPRH